MLPKQHRLDLREEKDFFSTARRIQTPFFRIFVQKYTGLSQATVIVPKTASLNAVKRILLKRKFRSALLPVVRNNNGFLIAVVVYEKALSLQVAEISRIINKKLEAIKP